MPASPSAPRRDALIAAAAALVLSTAVAIIPLVRLHDAAVLNAKESALKNNLFTLRTVIDEYTFDKQVAPRTLQDLVDQGYLRKIPVDPLTGSGETWRIVPQDPGFILGPTLDDRLQPGIWDVHSGSDRISLDHRRPYSDW
jgi:general secretion pathway protein G